MTDPGDLNLLHDLAVPPAPWWPPSPGWAILGLATLAALAVVAWRWMAHWWRNRYRREALAELTRLEAQPNGVAGLPELVKRAALSGYPRTEVAALSGSAWLAWLDRTGHTDAFTRGPGRALTEVAYAPTSPVNRADLFAAVRGWLKGHTPPC